MIRSDKQHLFPERERRVEGVGGLQRDGGWWGGERERRRERDRKEDEKQLRNL